jgi:hypothetical protein
MGAYDENDLVSIKDIRVMLGKGSRQGKTVSRTYAQQISSRKDFPAPAADLRHIRLWLRSDVEAWMDKNRPTWRKNPSADEAKDVNEAEYADEGEDGEF